MTKHPIVTRKLMWRDVLLVVREQHDYLWPGQLHIEIYVARPKHAVIPITETGYRSHFIDTEELSLAGGAVAFVTTWLDREAASKTWRRADLKSRQLSLDL